MSSWPYFMDITLGLLALVYANLPKMREPSNRGSRQWLKIAGYTILGFGVFRMLLSMRF